jgi:hypothetical protein
MVSEALNATYLVVIKGNDRETFREFIAVYAKREELWQCYH